VAVEEKNSVKLNLVDTLSELVAIPSVNPMGGTVSGAEYGVGRLTDHLQTLFERLGVRCYRQTVHPHGDNLLARLDGDVHPRKGKLILFGAHQDTVPVGGMSIEPWTPTVRQGRLYGRGACDVKGGMTAMLAAIARLAEERPTGMPTIVMACTVNEEYGFSGADALTKLLNGHESEIIPRKPDVAVIAEPTELDVVTAHKGVVRWRCHTRGRAGHSAQPENGDNAIYKMARALAVTERYQREIVGGLGSHARCGPATMSVGTIRGGVSVNTIPSHCTIEIDRRLPPGEEPQAAYRHFVEQLAQSEDLDFPVEHDPPYMQGPALSDDANGPLADRLEKVAREVVGQCRQVGVPYATDAAFLAAAGVPTVVFGPGSIEQAHTDDEWLPLNQLEQAAEVLYRFALADVD
jgi:acetylornithine deacetylase/succinyl-diaminopimelate desuccinylase-like protein